MAGATSEQIIVIPVLVAAEKRVVQTTSGKLSLEEIWVHCLMPPRVGQRASMAMQLPDDSRPEVVVGEVTESTRKEPDARHPGFRARFVDLPSVAQRRIASALKSASQNHRAFPRLPSKLRVMTGPNAFRARNISAVGIFVERLPGSAGEAFDVHLDLGDNGPVPAKALVIHGIGEGAGMQFVDSERTFRLRLDRYLASLAPPAA
ncbi:MAG: PilZ domain-containing protein [Deltaproteobacteria bacterium]|nr:MAG: PilZ domain-containing protein [Deltaproteobacteria bacterium]